MLPNLNLSSLTALNSALSTGETPEILGDSGGGLEETNPFFKLAKQMGFSFDGGDKEQELAAFLTALKSKVGEELPVEAEISPQLIEERASDEPPPEALEGDALLAYLMANAGDSSSLDDSVSLETLEALEKPAPLDLEMASISQGAENGGDQNLNTPLVNEALAALALESAEADIADESEIELETTESIDDVITSFSSGDDGAETKSEVLLSETGVENNKASINTTDGEGKLESGLGALESAAKDEAAALVLPNQKLTQSLEQGDSKAMVSQVTAAQTNTTLKPETTVQVAALDISDEPDDRRIQGSMLLAGAPLEDSAENKTDGLIKPFENPLTKSGEANQTVDAPKFVKPQSLTTDSGIRIDSSQPPLTQSFAEATIQNVSTFQRQTAETLQTQTLANDSVLRPMKLENFGSALADRIQTMVAGELKHAIIRLDPPELGALEVRVQVQQEQTQVQIVSQSSAVRDALEQQSARLREALAEQGLDLANLDVSDQQNRDGSQTSSGEGSEPGTDAEPEAPMEADVTTQVGLVDQYV